VTGELFHRWTEIPRIFRSATEVLPQPFEDIFGPLRQNGPDGVTVVGQIGQSLDGRIATPTGHSHYINGEDGLAHLHRLRALVDVVVVGIGTALADDPQLTVRRVEGPNPARAVIDPQGRLPPQARLFADDGVKTIMIAADDADLSGRAGQIDLCRLPRRDGSIAPADILAALAARGMKRILIEGGASTVSRFLLAGCLDRLHVVVAPVIIGAGPAGLSLPPIARMEEALRPRMRAHLLGNEVLFDCDLSDQRKAAAGHAKKST
jgi:riboflavin-specific deaminase-like protein